MCLAVPWLAARADFRGSAPSVRCSPRAPIAGGGRWVLHCGGHPARDSPAARTRGRRELVVHFVHWIKQPRESVADAPSRASPSPSLLGAAEARPPATRHGRRQPHRSRSRRAVSSRTAAGQARASAGRAPAGSRPAGRPRSDAYDAARPRLCATGRSSRRRRASCGVAKWRVAICRRVVSVSARWAKNVALAPDDAFYRPAEQARLTCGP